MSPKLFVLLVWAAVEKAGSAARPALTFRPNYNQIFPGENIKMSCESKPKEKDFEWFHNNVLVFKGEVYEIPKVESRHSGNYQCQSTDGSKSEVVVLTVTDGRVILQTPPYIHEGDRLTLRCHHNPALDAKRSKFSKDKAEIQGWGTEALYSKSSTPMDASGSYSCTKEVTQGSKTTPETAHASIAVKELFTTPEIQVTPNPGTGSRILTCQTIVSSYKPLTEPTYGFYKNAELVQSFGPNNRYEVPADPLRKSGKYSCAVRPKLSSLTKTSKEIAVSKSPALTQNVAGLVLSQCALLISFVFIT